MKILAVDTSGLEGSVALSDDRALLEERQLPVEGRRHAQTLVSAADELLKAHSLQPNDIGAVAVSVGPGSFTGLRVGVVFAKTFAWANQAQLLAVDTLRAVAQQVDSASPFVTVISDAQRQEVFVSTYQWDSQANIRTELEAVRIQPVASLAASVSQDTIWAGPGLSKFGEHLTAERLADESVWQPRAATIAELGSVMLQQNQIANIHTLEPVYIRRSYAEENAARR